MILKDIDFNQPPKLLINGIEYDFDHKLSGTQKAFNKGVVNIKNVVPKELKNFQYHSKTLLEITSTRLWSKENDEGKKIKGTAYDLFKNEQLSFEGNLYGVRDPRSNFPNGYTWIKYLFYDSNYNLVKEVKQYNVYIKNENGVFSVDGRFRLDTFEIQENNNSKLTTNDIVDVFTIFPKFSRVEIYYGDKLFYMGFISEQYGSANPLHPKYVNLKVLDGKQWLMQSEFINEIFLEMEYEAAVDLLIRKLQLPFFKKGKMQFDRNNKIDAWDSNKVDGYSVLRFIEKQSSSVLEILLEEDLTFSINFFSKAEIANPNGNKGIDMIIDTIESTKIFKSQYGLMDITWNKSSNKDFNISRVSADKIIASNPIEQTIDLSISNGNFPLIEAIGDMKKDEAFLYDQDNNVVRRLKIITDIQAQSGRQFDISFTPQSNTITINDILLKSTNKIVFKYFPVVEGIVEFEDVGDQQSISAYTKGTGKKARFDKHNDAGTGQTLIKYAKRNLELGIEDKLELNVTLEKTPWNVGEHVIVRHNFEELSGTFYVKNIKVNMINDNQGMIIGTFKYLLTKTSDFEDEINFYDDQSYRSNPVLQKQPISATFENISFNFNIVAKKPTITCLPVIGEADLQKELQAEVQNEIDYDETKIVRY